MGQARFYYRDAHAPRPNRPNHIGTSVLIEYGGKVLMEHRRDSDTWAVIGGGLWTGETLAACAVREVAEETGIVLDETELSFYKIYDDPSRIASYPDGNVLRVITVVYKVRLDDMPKLSCSNESKELRFFSREELSGLRIADTHIPIIEDCLR